MSNIHITLVGGQTTPVYQGFIASNPDRVILIHSEQTEAEANRITAEIEVRCELHLFDPVDLRKITEAINKLKESFTASDQITINVSSGTKPWSLLFFGMFSGEANATVFVIDQNNLMWDLKTHRQTEVVFDMDVQFRLLGNALKQYRTLDYFTVTDRALIEEIRALRAFNTQDFHQMTEFLYNHPNEMLATGKSNSTLRWNTETKQFECTMRNRQGREMYKTLHSEHVRYILLNSGWFELEIALMLATWEKNRAMRLNCIFPTKSGSPKNEIDIIVNAGTKLLFVECKTQIKNETDIDKFAAAVRVYGGLGSKALFVTDAPISAKAQEKCADHGIMTFSLQNNIANLPAEKLLFLMLDSELFNVNAK